MHAFLVRYSFIITACPYQRAIHIVQDFNYNIFLPIRIEYKINGKLSLSTFYSAEKRFHTMDENTTIGSKRLENFSLTRVVLFATESTFSLVVNLLVVFLFIFRRNLLSNPHNRCILSLAITDILTSISVLLTPRLFWGEKVYDVKSHDYFTRELYCRILWNNFLPFALGVTSVYTFVVLSFERWLSVRRSLFYKSRFKIRHMNVLIMVSWTAGFTAEVPVAILSEKVFIATYPQIAADNL